LLRKEENDLRTCVGPGAPCGVLLRRYWWPVTCSDYLGGRPMRIMLLGQDFVLFRKPNGVLGFLDLHCTHRGASLEFGRVETQGLRCCYHGKLYDECGRYQDQMCEPDGGEHRENYRQGAYPVIEKSGLIFVYIGPDDTSPFPKWDVLFNDKCDPEVAESYHSMGNMVLYDQPDAVRARIERGILCWAPLVKAAGITPQ
jgi:phenylpropionate dioxygenase-like ring-hydroxylating dioxygenase large terminal subunit